VPDFGGKSYAVSSLVDTTPSDEERKKDIYNIFSYIFT
jgi:hypothetical protein